MANCLAPGFASTGRSSGTYPESSKRDLYLEHISLRRFTSPEEIAGVVEFPAADLSGYVTGGTINKIQL